MSQFDDEKKEKSEYCIYCKELIEENADYVYKKGDYYHLYCYHLLIDLPLEELEEEEE